MILISPSRDRILSAGVYVAWGLTPRDPTYTIQDPNRTFVTRNNKDLGNSINNNFTTNSIDLDIGLSLTMDKEHTWSSSNGTRSVPHKPQDLQIRRSNS